MSDREDDRPLSVAKDLTRDLAVAGAAHAGHLNRVNIMTLVQGKPPYTLARPELIDALKREAGVPGLSYQLGRGSYNPETKVVKHFGNAAVLAHELGHAQVDHAPVVGGTITPTVRASNNSTGISALARAALPEGKLRDAAPYLVHAPRLLHELAANAQGYRTLRNAGARPEELRDGRKLLLRSAGAYLLGEGFLAVRDDFLTRPVARLRDMVFEEKNADHAGDRFEERLPGVDPSVLQDAREYARHIPKGPEQRLHLPLIQDNKLLGYAAYKRVGRAGKPVLATILGPEMHPRNSYLLPTSPTAHLEEGEIRSFLSDFREEARKRNLNVFVVADNPRGGASVSLGLTQSPAVANARKAHTEWETAAGHDPHHDWGKPKTAANRMTKILDQAKKLAPASVMGTLPKSKQVVMDQAAALLEHPRTSDVASLLPHRPKSLFDLHLDVAKPVEGDLASLMAEARNPATPASRLAQLAHMKHAPLIEAAATNPSAGGGMEYLHQIRPDLAEANPAAPLHRLMNGGELPRIPDAEFKDIRRNVILNSRLSAIGEGRNPVSQGVMRRLLLQVPFDPLPFRAPGMAKENMRIPLSGQVAHPTSDPDFLAHMSPVSRQLSGKLLRESQKTAAPRTKIYAGLRVRIDRPAGYVQKGKDAEGNTWERTYKCDYGYLAGTQGGDGDGMDVFLGPDPDGQAFLIHQKKVDGSFDEYKMMLGFKDAYSAKAMYLQHVPARFLGKIERVPVGLLQGLTGRAVDHSKVAAPAWVKRLRGTLSAGGPSAEILQGVRALPARRVQ